jgi:hypothetical protein
MSLVDSESSSFLEVPHAMTKKMKKEVSVYFHCAASPTSRTARTLTICHQLGYRDIKTEDGYIVIRFPIEDKSSKVRLIRSLICTCPASHQTQRVQAPETQKLDLGPVKEIKGKRRISNPRQVPRKYKTN